jgi:hypothetical protein
MCARHKSGHASVNAFGWGRSKMSSDVWSAYIRLITVRYSGCLSSVLTICKPDRMPSDVSQQRMLLTCMLTKSGMQSNYQHWLSRGQAQSLINSCSASSCLIAN